MRKEKQYSRAIFSADVVREAFETLAQIPGESYSLVMSTRTLSRGTEKWDFDSDEEYFAEYRQGFESTYLYGYAYNEEKEASWGELSFSVHGINAKVTVSAKERRDIERVFDVFERHHAESKLPVPTAPEPPPPPPPTVFIGHGRSQQWRDLKDHLTDQHGYAVEAYEVGARAGHAIRDILADMLVNSSFAVLVMTAEDETAEGEFRARQNVVHETGLFQGKLGFSRAIVLVEDGVEVFSNLHGIQQIRYSKGNIRETFGDVLATLRREFGSR
jgi:predicted nucleotide-binding protein